MVSACESGLAWLALPQRSAFCVPVEREDAPKAAAGPLSERREHLDSQGGQHPAVSEQQQLSCVGLRVRTGEASISYLC
jgi:hypothetical protein